MSEHERGGHEPQDPGPEWDLDADRDGEADEPDEPEEDEQPQPWAKFSTGRDPDE